MTSDPTDKRLVARDERITINKEFNSIEDLISEYVSNISKTGAFIRSDDPLPIGTMVNLKFTVFVDDPETIEGTGEVMRVSDDPKGMGVVFTELDSMSRIIVERLIVRQRRAK